MTPRQRPTRRQLEVLRAYIAAGSIAAAAYELGISETTARQHLSGCTGGRAASTRRRRRTGLGYATSVRAGSRRRGDRLVRRSRHDHADPCIRAVDDEEHPIVDGHCERLVELRRRRRSAVSREALRARACDGRDDAGRVDPTDHVAGCVGEVDIPGVIDSDRDWRVDRGIGRGATISR